MNSTISSQNNLVTHLLSKPDFEENEIITPDYIQHSSRERSIGVAGDDPTRPPSPSFFGTSISFIKSRKEHQTVKQAILDSIQTHYGPVAAERFKSTYLSFVRASSPLTHGALKAFNKEVLQPIQPSQELEQNSCSYSLATISGTDLDEVTHAIPIAGNYEIHDQENLHQVDECLTNQLRASSETQDVFANDTKEDSVGNLTFHISTNQGDITGADPVFKAIAKELTLSNNEASTKAFQEDLKKIFNQGLFSSATAPFVASSKDKTKIIPTGACYRPTVRTMNVHFFLDPVTKKLTASVTGSKKIEPEELRGTSSTTVYYQAKKAMVRLALDEHVVSSSTTITLDLAVDSTSGHITPSCTSLSGSWKIQPKTLKSTAAFS